MKPNNLLWQAIEGQLVDQDLITDPLQLEGAVAGGDINRSFSARSGQQRFFIKVNRGVPPTFFSAEAEGLREIAGVKAIRCPVPLAAGDWEDWQYLVQEFLPLSANGDQFLLGQQLATLHRSSGVRSDPHPYGFSADNFIGSTPQYNRNASNWEAFWWKRRLQPQLELACQNGFSLLKKFTPQLSAASSRYLQNHHPEPCLLHGDLWSGNMGFCGDEPVIFDPASYYGDRETDLAMTELFGGFSSHFYDGYRSIWPVDDGYRRRRPLYNLYHQLNHLNLFGSSYLGSCKHTIEGLINTRQAG